LDEAFGGEHLERLAQRRARNLQLLAEVAFGNSRPRRNFAFEQHGADLAHHLLMQHRCVDPQF
jgi:hypothetical protein